VWTAIVAMNEAGRPENEVKLGRMARGKIDLLESIRASVRLSCLCSPGLKAMKMVAGTSASAKPANASSVLRFECAVCRCQIGVEVIVQPTRTAAA